MRYIMIKVSIIIPIYNAEEYLVQCIKSVFLQTLKDLEIICIDDGSVDNSVEIIQKFQLKDERIVLLRQENQGAGAARNFAMKKAKGKYIAFLDADDYYIDKDSLCKMYDICEKVKIPVCGSLRKNIINGVIEDDTFLLNFPKNEVLCYDEYQIDYNYQNFLFLRQFLEEKKICFPLYRRFQDPPFLVKALYEAKIFIVANTYLYGYRLIDRSSQFNFKNTYDLLCGLTDNLLYSQKYHLNSLFEKTMFRLEQEYMWVIFKNFMPDDLRILIKLLEANKIITEYINKTNYVIRPLRAMLLYANQYEKKLVRRIKNQDSVLIYGAGRYGKVFLEFLKKYNLLEKVDCFVVTCKKNNPEYIENIPVIALQELQMKKKNRIYVTVGANLQGEVDKRLKEISYKNYEIICDEFLYINSNEMECGDKEE